MQSKLVWSGMVAAALLAAGCDKSEDAVKDEAKVTPTAAADDGTRKPTAVATAKDDAQSTSPPPAAAPPGAGDVAAPGDGAQPPAPAPGLTDGRSETPTLAEFDAVGEVNVKGSTALNCETKKVREWLRVSCRGKNDTDGTPTALRVTSGGGNGDVFTYVGGGRTSLLLRYVSGTHVEAIFSWTDKSHLFVSEWPRGAPEPTIKGVFEGAKSPLDAPKISGGGKSCSDNADCGSDEACCWDPTNQPTPACMSSWCLDRYVQACRSGSACPVGYGCVTFHGRMSCTPPGVSGDM
jgi:hypothetical protein